MRDQIRKFCATCDICQRNKRTFTNLGKLPEKQAECEPWEQLHVDMIGPYKVRVKGKRKPVDLHCVTMIDPATGWFEMKSVDTKSPDVIANVVEQTWLSRYPLPRTITYDRGGEFMAEFAEMMDNEHSVTRRMCSARNPQSNAIIERAHQTVGNMIRTVLDKEVDYDQDNPLDGILAAIMFAVRATVRQPQQATPAQLVFGRDAIFNTPFKPDWEQIRERKQKIIKDNNDRENENRKTHHYQVGDQVLVKRGRRRKFDGPLHAGPYTVTRVHDDNGTLRLRKGRVTDTYNVRQVKPYLQAEEEQEGA